MTPLKIIQRAIKQILTNNAHILYSWRFQDLNTGRRVKNFENWLLVELVHHMYRSKLATRIKTNGRVRKASYGRKGPFNQLKGRKKHSKNLSPDLSIEFINNMGWLDIDIKTQTSPQDILDDAKIAHFHNINEKNLKHKAAFLWVVIEPKPGDDKSNILADRVKKSAQGIVTKANNAGLKLRLEEIPKIKWLYYSLTHP